MDAQEFTRLLATFADTPSAVDSAKGEFLVQVRGETISGTMLQRPSGLFIEEGSETIPAFDWLLRRVARPQQLADRILDYIPEEPHFVVPCGVLLDTVDNSPNDAVAEAPDAAECIRAFLDRRPAGVSTILYLTSDAGEGKTTLINRLARNQAQAYKAKTSDWLLVPVPLGGRTLLRFDDVVIGALVNRLRFQLWYYEAAIELVRMGVVVLALDGFEEMFIEGSTGEAVSALGNLLSMLRSAGTLLVSARKAYFEYKSFATQARLFDAVRADSIAFSRLALNRWGEQQFLDYCHKRGLRNGSAIYSEATDRLGKGHPVVTRAVLVKRLLDVAGGLQDRGALLERLEAAPQTFFAEFVDTILERERTEKWIDRRGEPAGSLLSRDEHYELLSLVAQEMWTTASDALQDEVLDVVADMFCESHRKRIEEARQIHERLRQHALIVRPEAGRPTYEFDHKEFQEFFLGYGVARTILSESGVDAKRLLDGRLLPDQCAETAAHFVGEGGRDVVVAIRFLQALSRSASPASAILDNCGGIAIRLLPGLRGRQVTLTKMRFPPEALAGKKVRSAGFEECQFQPTSLTDASISDCFFDGCTFERLELVTGAIGQNVILRNSSVSCVVPAGSEVHVYDPVTSNALLRRAGFGVEEAGRPEPGEPERETDRDLVLAERAIRAFLRATEINEGVIRKRMGQEGWEAVEELVRQQVLEEVPYRGSGRQRRFRLKVQMRAIEDALERCDGTFAGFLGEVTSR